MERKLAWIKKHYIALTLIVTCLGSTVLYTGKGIARYYTNVIQQHPNVSVERPVSPEAEKTAKNDPCLPVFEVKGFVNPKVSGTVFRDTCAGIRFNQNWNAEIKDIEYESEKTDNKAPLIQFLNSPLMVLTLKAMEQQLVPKVAKA